MVILKGRPAVRHIRTLSHTLSLSLVGKIPIESYYSNDSSNAISSSRSNTNNDDDNNKNSKKYASEAHLQP